ncbi:TroA family protein [Serratia fonticola]|uniref:hypothetical protein n=1 Tax=Serratia fonticola TaxID=47917 RepID=UPI00217C3CE4|nr:hypothetical protein [Serratia fonticola]CAI1661656.1 Uncharacterised protein [Serratia fonticola]
MGYAFAITKIFTITAHATALRAQALARAIVLILLMNIDCQKRAKNQAPKSKMMTYPRFFSHKSFLTLILSGTYKPTITTQITVATLPSIPFSVLAVALLGMSSFALSKTGSEYLSPTLAKLPRLSGRASPLSQEKILPLNPDIIIDCVSADDTYKFT